MELARSVYRVWVQGVGTSPSWSARQALSGAYLLRCSERNCASVAACASFSCDRHSACVRQHFCKLAHA